jgi:uncharacterized protein (DUF934 family)
MQFIDTAPAAADPHTLVLENTDDVVERAAEVAAARTVVLQFPKWTDGRAYTQARLLRSRLRFAGTLVATGEVLVDMLPLLQRCGVDTVHLRSDQDPRAARRALDFFPGHYQADVASTHPSHPASVGHREATRS